MISSLFTIQSQLVRLVVPKDDSRRRFNGKTVNNTFVQHDAAINSGNSGGGLYDIYGRLIGINTWKLVGDPGDNFEGLNFAIPSTVVYTTFESYLKND